MTSPIEFLPHDAPDPARVPSAPPPAAPPSLAEGFLQFADHEVRDEPLYQAMSRAAAASPARAALLEAAPPGQRKPVLWFAALHDRLLELADAGRAPPLAGWYGSLGGTRAPDDPELLPALDAVLAAEAGALRERIAHRATQTNEVGRSAVLAPLLADLAARAGSRPLALLDVGCSAGLNLGVDHYGVRYVDASGAVVAERAGDAGVPPVETRLVGGDLPSTGPLPIASRRGLDIAPVDPADDREVRWLRACLWPSDRVRRERLDAALALARRERWDVRRVDDVTGAMEDWLATLDPGCLPVVFNSWVLAYLEPPALERHVRLLMHRVAEGRAAWVSAEAPALMRGAWPDLPEATPAAVADARDAGLTPRELAITTWTVAEAQRGAIAHEPTGAVAWRLAARTHPHGRWARFGDR